MQPEDRDPPSNAPFPSPTGWRRLVPRRGAAHDARLPPAPTDGPSVAPADAPPAVHTASHPSPPRPRQLLLRASIAELLLVTRLQVRSLFSRARVPGFGAARQRDVEQAELMARYAQILAVTCKHWFPDHDAKPPPPQRRL